MSSGSDLDGYFGRTSSKVGLLPKGHLPSFTIKNPPNAGTYASPMDPTGCGIDMHPLFMSWCCDKKTGESQPKRGELN